MTPGQHANDSAPDRRSRVRSNVLLGAAGVLLVVGLGVYLAFHLRQRTTDDGKRTNSLDPRLNYAGPYQNVNPAVQYVPEERCGDCHADKARSFAEHPMGRSLLPISRATAPPEDPRHRNPFEALGSQFLVNRDGDNVRHRRSRLDPTGRPIAALDWEAHYVIGSGFHGYSFLSDRDGYLFQTPISWYSQKKTWDLSPGFGPNYLTGRPILPECLFCHTNRVQFVDGSLNRYTEPIFDGHAIGCQRCHGPGELHVARRERLDPVPDDVDYTIVNPRHLERSQREAVCEQCHLEGETRIVRHGRAMYDFRPGLPLEQFWSVFVHPPEASVAQKVVSHVEQMYESRCFQDGRLGCISCHDPHQRVKPERRVEHYRAACLECHGQGSGCSLPKAQRLRQNAQDSCIDCHMPRYGASDVPHTAFTDHRILRAGQPTGRRFTRLAGQEGLPVLSFYRDREHSDAGEDDRDLGLALVKLALQGDAAAARIVRRALPMLEAALERDPDDLSARESRGCALALGGRSAEALAAFEAVLANDPERELSLMGAASTAGALGQKEAELRYLRRAIAANPWAPDYRRNLVLLLVKNEKWTEARPECEAWVRLDPFNVEARQARVLCLLAIGEKDEAQVELARIETLTGKNVAEPKRSVDKAK